jgi:hypothetical protein
LKVFVWYKIKSPQVLYLETIAGKSWASTLKYEREAEYRECQFQDIVDRCALCRPLLDDVYGALR